MKKEAIQALIEETGIVPVIRAASPEEARFAAEAVSEGGIPIVEITMTVPGAIKVIAELAKTMPGVLVGAGTVVSQEAAKQCADAGAKFLVTPGFGREIVETARAREILIMAGALTPTEVMAAWDSGADFVKIFPCGNLGGPAYVRALKGPFPKIPMVPTGGVNLANAGEYVRAGAVALGVGGELISKQALKERQAETIRNLAQRYLQSVKHARSSPVARS